MTQDRHEDDQHLETVRPEERDDAADRLAATLLGDRGEVAGRAAPEWAAHAAATAASAAASAAAPDGATGGGPGAPARERHQAVAVAASVMP